MNAPTKPPRPIMPILVMPVLLLCALAGAGLAAPARRGAAKTAARPNAEGDVKWLTFLGGTGYDVALETALLPDGGLVLAGSSDATWGNPLRTHGDGDDAFVARLDGNGNLMWNTFLGGAGSDYGRVIALLPDGGLAVIGTSWATWGNPLRAHAGGFDAFVARLDANGNLTWLTFLGGMGADDGAAITLLPDGGLAVAGRSRATWGNPLRTHGDGDDAFVARLDGNGNLMWDTFLGGAGSDGGREIALMPDGGLAVAGESSASWGNPLRAYGSDGDAFVARLDGNGNLKWHTFLGGPERDEASAITVLPDGGLAVAGQSRATWGNPLRAYGSDNDAFVARLDGNGNLIWHTFLGGTGDDNGRAIALMPDGGLAVAGYSSDTWGNPLRAHGGGRNYDAYVARLDGNGNLIWHTFLGGTSSDSGYAIALMPDGGLAVAGQSDAAWGNPLRAYAGNNDAFIVRLAGPPIPSGNVLYAPVLIKDYPQPRECDAPGLDCGEPNDQVGQAYGPLQLGRTYYGTVGAANDARDFYRLDLQAGSTYDVMLNFDGFDNPANADLDIVVRRNEPPNYAQVTFSSNQNLRFERFSFSASSTGSYLFVIDSAVPNVRTVYTLQVQQRPGRIITNYELRMGNE